MVLPLAQRFASSETSCVQLKISFSRQSWGLPQPPRHRGQHSSCPAGERLLENHREGLVVAQQGTAIPAICWGWSSHQVKLNAGRSSLCLLNPSLNLPCLLISTKRLLVARAARGSDRARISAAGTGSAPRPSRQSLLLSRASGAVKRHLWLRAACRDGDRAGRG